MNIQRSEIKVYRAVQRGELEIDNEGRIWRTHLQINNRWTGQLTMKPCKRRRAEHRVTQGYLQVHLMENKVRANASAHRLVWHHFFGAIPDGLTINHKNGIKDDNHPQNLELATASQQALHAARVLKTARCANQQGEKHHRPKLTDDQVIEIRQLLAQGLAKQQELADRFQVSQPTISDIRRRRTWTHLP